MPIYPDPSRSARPGHLQRSVVLVTYSGVLATSHLQRSVGNELHEHMLCSSGLERRNFVPCVVYSGKLEPLGRRAVARNVPDPPQRRTCSQINVVRCTHQECTSASCRQSGHDLEQVRHHYVATEVETEVVHRCAPSAVEIGASHGSQSRSTGNPSPAVHSALPVKGTHASASPEKINTRYF